MSPGRPKGDDTDSAWRDTFVEELGALGPEIGFPRAMMRITAWMMVCDPPEQSAQQIRDGLRLSAAAVSAAARQLIAAGMLERVSRPGDRRIYYRLASGSWDAPLRAKLRAGPPASCRRQGHRRRGRQGGLSADRNAGRLRVVRERARPAHQDPRAIRIAFNVRCNGSALTGTQGVAAIGNSAHRRSESGDSDQPAEQGGATAHFA